MPRPRQGNDAATATRILDVAEMFVQKRGFNGFSYANVAAELRITTASLHYHFPSKAELGRSLIERYAQRFLAALADLNIRIADPRRRLEAYADLYGEVLRNQRLCLCGMLAAEYQTLPDVMREAVIRFFDANEAWLASVLEKGRREGGLHYAGNPREVARAIVSGLEGAMLVARPYGDPSRFRSAARHLVASLDDPSPTAT